MTDCREQRWLFQYLGSRKVEVDFGGGYLSSDGGGLILRELERHSGLLRDFAGCFVDYRDSRYIEHSVQELVSQRIHGLVLVCALRCCAWAKCSSLIASRRARGSRRQSPANVPRPSSHLMLVLLSNPRSVTKLFTESFKPLSTLSTLGRTQRVSAGTCSLNSYQSRINPSLCSHKIKRLPNSTSSPALPRTITWRSGSKRLRSFSSLGTGRSPMMRSCACFTAAGKASITKSMRFRTCSA